MAYFNMEKKREAASVFFLNNNHAGIIVSMAVHALLIALFLLQPAAKMATVKTFHISFSGGGSAPPAPGRAGVVENKPPIAAPVAAKKPVTAAPAPVKKTVTAPVAPAIKNTAVTKPVEAPLPLVANDPKTSQDDAFIAATGNVFRSSAPAAETTVSGAFQNGTGSGSAVSSGFAAENGAGNGSGNGSMSGSGGGAPIETSFGEMNAPSFIRRVMPVYPPLARRRGKEGRVVLTLLIDQAGKVQKIDVTESGGYGLTEAAIDAVKKSTFAPARVNGERVVSRAVLPIRFKLE